MNDKTLKLVEQYCEAHEELYSAITEMKGYGKACECGSLVALTMIDDITSEIRKYCLECGGYAR
jgi:hypothetical protein